VYLHVAWSSHYLFATDIFDRTPTGLHGLRVASSQPKHVPQYHTRGREDRHQP